MSSINERYMKLLSAACELRQLGGLTKFLGGPLGTSACRWLECSAPIRHFLQLDLLL